MPTTGYCEKGENTNKSRTMKLEKLLGIDFQNVEGLSLELKREKVSRERFSLEIPERDCANAIYAAMKASVE